MARLDMRRKMQLVAYILLEMELIEDLILILILLVVALLLRRNRKPRVRYVGQVLERLNVRTINLTKMVFENDRQAIDNIRMDRRAFHRLCHLLQTQGRLKASKNMSIEEMVISFMHIVGHHAKNRVIKRQVARSGETISRYFHAVLKAVLKLHSVLLAKPEPINENCTDGRWKWFKGCLGALDGTFIQVHVPTKDRPKYRNRKGDIATNVIGVCRPDLQFIYVLPGWEGSATDGRVIRDAITRRNGLKIPQGNYYLVDVGYTNGEGILAPYRAQRYHLSEWRHGHQPNTPHEYYNMKHSQARNCIERCFGILKARFAILRDKSFYPVKTQCRIISACCLLHNFIRKEMPRDPFEVNDGDGDANQGQDHDGGGVEYIRYCETSAAWTAFRDNLAVEMFTAWQNSRNA